MSQAEPTPRYAVSTPVTLLGPQRRPRVGKVAESLGLAGPFATVTAGWQEREPDDGELDEVLGGGSVNLRLWARWQDVTDRDPEYAAAVAAARAVLDEMQELYLLGLDHAMQAILAIQRRPATSAEVVGQAVGEALWVVREMDHRHLRRVAAVHAEFYQRWVPHERTVVAEHRAAVREQLAQAQALVLAGGHVGVLLETLHLFNVAAELDLPVIAWSAGAMALADRVVLFNDRAAHGPTSAEVWDHGLGLVQGVVPLPSPRRRLDTHDTTRMGLFARRFAPARCLVLDEGVRVDLRPDQAVPSSAPILTVDGRIRAVEQDVA